MSIYRIPSIARPAVNPYETDAREVLAEARNLTVDRRLDVVGVNEQGIVDQELLRRGYTYQVSALTSNNDLQTTGHESIGVGGRKIWSAQFDTRLFAERMTDGMTPLAVVGFYAGVQRAIRKENSFPVAGKDGSEDVPELLPPEGVYEEQEEDGTPLIYSVINKDANAEAPTIGGFTTTEVITYGESVLFLANRAGGWTDQASTYIKPQNLKDNRKVAATNSTSNAKPETGVVVNLADYLNRR